PRREPFGPGRASYKNEFEIEIKTMTKRILVLPGDGIGPEIVAEAVKLLDVLVGEYGLDVEMDEGLVGGAQ
ncbi:MAG: isocitrate/isopropylmalate family dehydrogenase, partial [Ignavibacteriaceae bacterium]|nr:isocitrate/isopropylmalate family dehydrogenase [Ignavibacteriaceae bacterium]